MITYLGSLPPVTPQSRSVCVSLVLTTPQWLVHHFKEEAQIHDCSIMLNSHGLVTAYLSGLISLHFPIPCAPAILNRLYFSGMGISSCLQMFAYAVSSHRNVSCLLSLLCSSDRLWCILQNWLTCYFQEAPLTWPAPFTPSTLCPSWPNLVLGLLLISIRAPVTLHCDWFACLSLPLELYERQSIAVVNSHQVMESDLHLIPCSIIMWL